MIEVEKYILLNELQTEGSDNSISLELPKSKEKQNCCYPAWANIKMYRYSECDSVLEDQDLNSKIKLQEAFTAVDLKAVVKHTQQCSALHFSDTVDEKSDKNSEKDEKTDSKLGVPYARDILQMRNPEIIPITIAPVFEPMAVILNKIASGEHVPPEVSMRYEMLRFCSLRSYPQGNKPFLIRFAQSGFYYASNGDEVVCYCCAKRVSSWTSQDDPLQVHRQISPTCRFLTNNAEVNVPIFADGHRNDEPGPLDRFTLQSSVTSHDVHSDIASGGSVSGSATASNEVNAVGRQLESNLRLDNGTKDTAENRPNCRETVTNSSFRAGAIVTAHAASRPQEQEYQVYAAPELPFYRPRESCSLAEITETNNVAATGPSSDSKVPARRNQQRPEFNGARQTTEQSPPWAAAASSTSENGMCIILEILHILKC